MNTNSYPFMDRFRYEMIRSEYVYTLPPCRTLYVGAVDGDLEVRIVHHDDDDYTYYVGDDSYDFWVGASLYWYDAMSDTYYNSIQIDAIARLAQYLGYVPNEDQVKQYAVPNKDEVCTWFEMVTLLKSDGVERHEA